jgi:hypothetical protein
MIATYYMNKNQQPNGDYEVHVYGCQHGAHPENWLVLGDYENCQPAVAEAIKRYQTQVTQYGGRINGCFYCCNPCNTG